MIACGEADSVPTVQNKLTETKPRLVLIGLRLGAGDSLELVKAIKAQIPGLLVLVYSAFEETIFAERALRAGAHGYVMKKAPKEELLMAIRDIVQGRIYVSRDVAMRAFKKALQTRPEHRLSAPPALWKTYRTARCTSSSCLARALAKDKSLTP